MSYYCYRDIRTKGHFKDIRSSKLQILCNGTRHRNSWWPWV